MVTMPRCDMPATGGSGGLAAAMFKRTQMCHGCINTSQSCCAHSVQNAFQKIIIWITCWHRFENKQRKTEIMVEVLNKAPTSPRGISQWEIKAGEKQCEILLRMGRKAICHSTLSFAYCCKTTAMFTVSPLSCQLRTSEDSSETMPNKSYKA